MLIIMSAKENITDIIEKRNKLQEFIKLNDRLTSESPNHTDDMTKYTTTQKLIKILNNKIMILKSLNTVDKYNSVAKSEPTIKTEAPKPMERPPKTNIIRNIIAIQIKNKTYIDNSKNKLIETQTNVVNTLNKLINVQPNKKFKSELIAKVTQTAENYLKIKSNIECGLKKFIELQKKVISSIESNKDINTQKNISESCIKQFNELKEFIIKCTSESRDVFQTLNVRLNKITQQEANRQEANRQQQANRQENIKQSIEKDTILVVMPTYNRSENIENSIAMLNNQTINNWVFLIIDDGSNENHKHKFREIQEKYQSTTIIFQENEVNCHIAKTLNKGIHYLLDSCTNFTHFTWISDDNEYYPNFLAELYNENTFFKYGTYNVQELDGNINTNNKVYQDFDNLLNHFAGCASFMWTKEAINEIGFYDETIPGCEDFEYLLRTFKLNAFACNYTHIPTMKYIRHLNSLMEQQRNPIMNIKHKIMVDYKLKYIDTISYIKYPETEYLMYYTDKTNKLVDLCISISNTRLNIDTIHILPVFDTNYVNILSDNYNSTFEALYNFFASSHSSKLYIFNELDYCTFKAFYERCDINKKCLVNFLTKVTYIITCTEIFENDNFQTIGNTSYSKEYSITFFKNAYKILLCDTTNLQLIYTNITPHNVLYNPPIIYSTNLKYAEHQNNEKDIDLLFYGSMHDTQFYYRRDLINIVTQYAKSKGYNFKLYNRQLFGEEKDNILKRTKIVIHVGSLPNLRTIPWAKITELLYKEVFFCIEQNTHEFYYKGFHPPSYQCSYDDNKISTNICEVLDYYLLNPEERQKSIKTGKDYILQYNNSAMFSRLINYNVNINTIVKNTFNFNRTKCDITTINCFYYGTQNFHSNLISQYKCFVEQYGIRFCYKETFPSILEGFTQNKEKFFAFLYNYIPDNNCLYVFNAEDLMAFYYYYDAKNMELIYKFINTAKYILFQYEVIINDNLNQIGGLSDYLINKHMFDFTKFERDKFLKDFYINSQKIYVCSTVNNNFLNINGIRNTVYFPPYINIPFEVINNPKTIDCLFYGTIEMDKHYRNNFIDKIKPELETVGLKLIVEGNLYGEKLNIALNDTKIVLHIPSHERLETMPWAKISHLMVNKIFFIIEENEEMYTKNLQNIIVFYKHGDNDDLKNKIVDFINHEDRRQQVVEACYNYYTDNFNTNILLDDLGV